MPTATLKKATEKLGLYPDDVVHYYRKGNKRIIEADSEVHRKQETKEEKKDVFANILAMSKDVGIKDWARNLDHYLYGTPKRSKDE